jgi:hypothetical protein
MKFNYFFRRKNDKKTNKWFVFAKQIRAFPRFFAHFLSQKTSEKTLKLSCSALHTVTLFPPSNHDL